MFFYTGMSSVSYKMDSVVSFQYVSSQNEYFCPW